MEELKIDVAEVSPFVEREGKNIHMHRKRTHKENQKPGRDVLEEEHSTKQAHLSRIKEAKQLLQKTKQDHYLISQKLKQKRVDEDRLVWRLEQFNYKDSALRERAGGSTKNLNFLQLTLDKLQFANKAYRERPFKSCSSNRMLDTQKGSLDLLQLALQKLYSKVGSDWKRSDCSCSSLQELDKNKLHFRMLHGTNTLAKEKQLLKEINAGQQKCFSSCFSLNDLNQAIWRFHPYDWRYQRDPDEERISKEKNELIHLQEKAIANAAVKGKQWNSLGSKQAIQEKAKLIGTELDEIRGEILSQGAIIKRVKRQLEKVRQDIKSLQKQLAAACQRKQEAYNSFLICMQHDENGLRVSTV